MGLIEIPLWIHHGNDESTNNTFINNDNSRSSGGSGGGGGNSEKNSDGESNINIIEKEEDDRWIWLDSRNPRCPIYSCDVFDDLLATGGADGKVRLWQMSRCSKFTKIDNNDDDEEHDRMDVSVNNLSNDDDDNDDDDDGNASTNYDEYDSYDEDEDEDGLFKRRERKKKRIVKVLSVNGGTSALCVRFSKKGHQLAFGGDDGFVHVYYNVNYANSSSGESSKNSSEWKRLKSWKGHELDVMGLVWAPDDSCLVSCSLDQHLPIVVWHDIDQIEPYSTKQLHKSVLQNHSSHVKGLVFCPTGKFLISYGDDSLCTFWCTRTWTCTKTVSSHQNASSPHKLITGSTTLFRRLDICPDGTHICCTHVTMKNRHVARMIPRNSTTNTNTNMHRQLSHSPPPTCLIGHKQPIVCAKYFPYLLEPINTNTNTKNTTKDTDITQGIREYATWLALGDKGGFVSVWSTKQSRPFFKLQCSESGNTITDLAWDSNGVLYVSLFDGIIIQLHLLRSKASDFRKATVNKTKSLFTDLYGIEEYAPGYSHILQIPKLLRTAQEEENTFLKHTLSYTYNTSTNESNHKKLKITNTNQETPSLSQAAAEMTVQKQVTTQKNGKKRITPISMNGTSAMTTIPKKNSNESNKACKETTLLEQALEFAEKAAAIPTLSPLPNMNTSNHKQQHLKRSLKSPKSFYSTPISNDIIVECTNNINDSHSTTLLVRKGENIVFKELLLNHVTTAIAATNNKHHEYTLKCQNNTDMIVLGTDYGHVNIYQVLRQQQKPKENDTNEDVFDNSSVQESVLVQKSVPPLIMDSTIHTLLLHQEKELLLVVTAQNFTCYLYDLKLMKLLYRINVPKQQFTDQQLVRVEWFQESFLVIIAMPFHSKSKKNQKQRQAWFYHLPMQTFIRVADSHAHLLSQYVHSYATATEPTTGKPVSLLLTPYERVLQCSNISSTRFVLQNKREQLPCPLSTWSHLQDRLVTTRMFLPDSLHEYRHWLQLYVQYLAQQNRGPELSWFTQHLLTPANNFIEKNPPSNKEFTKKLLQEVVLPTLTEYPQMQDIQQELSLFSHTL